MMMNTSNNTTGSFQSAAKLIGVALFLICSSISWRRVARLPIFLVICQSLQMQTAFGQIPISNPTDGVYSQSFSSVNSGSWTNNTSLPGCYIDAWETGINATAMTYLAPGYVFGNAASVFGSGSNASIGFFAENYPFALGVEFYNGTSTPIRFTDLAYLGEQWSIPDSAVNSLSVSYLISSSAITNTQPQISNGWTSLDALYFAAPLWTGNRGSGTTPPYEALLDSPISIDLEPGQYLMFRWLDYPAGILNAASLSVGSVNIAYSAPEPSPVGLFVSTIFLVGLRKRHRARRST